MPWPPKVAHWPNTYENATNPSLKSVLMTFLKCVFVPRIGFRRTRTQPSGTQ